MRGVNSGIVLQLLRRFERLSRAEIARHSGLSEGTISRIVSELVRQRLVMELERKTQPVAARRLGSSYPTRLSRSEWRFRTGRSASPWSRCAAKL